MICPSCNKFPAFDTSNEPEIDNLDVMIDADKEDPIKGEAAISGTVRIFLTSECCSEEMKETTFDIDLQNVEVVRHAECTCGDKWHESPNVEASDAEITDRSQSTTSRIVKRGPNKGQTVTRPIPYRYQKRLYGAHVNLEVTCACGKSLGTAEFNDECPAGGMDELC